VGLLRWQPDTQFVPGGAGPHGNTPICECCTSQVGGCGSIQGQVPGCFCTIVRSADGNVLLQVGPEYQDFAQAIPVKISSCCLIKIARAKYMGSYSRVLRHDFELAIMQLIELDSSCVCITGAQSPKCALSAMMISGQETVMSAPAETAFLGM